LQVEDPLGAIPAGLAGLELITL
ncbi:MAG: hypothetical protein RL309_238, partial [Verrucomicrobiota bacterium]